MTGSIVAGMSIGRGRLKSVGGHVVLALLALTALFPLALVALNSLKRHSDVVRNPLAWPTVFELSNFTEAWKFGHFGRGFINSIVLTGTTVVVVLFCSTLAGYVLANKKIRLWPLVMIYFMVAMTVPIQLFLFPLYWGFARLNLLGNLVAVGAVIAAMNMPLSVFLMRTFFLRVPRELEEAAIMDGAGTYRVLRHIMLPVVSPGLITVGVVVGLMAWNEFLITSTFLLGQDNFTATLGFLSMNGTFTSNQGVMMAGAMILIAPAIIFFITVQRYVVDGFVAGAVKG
jgi:raffinose/stachyose/melibiose transport system permease protein